MVLFSTSGLMLMASGNELMSIYLALEVTSLSLAFLAAWNKRERALIATDPDRVPPLALPPLETGCMLGSMRGEQRLVAFLLDLAARYQRLGQSSYEFILRMTRAEIASLLGLELETVSRLFSHLHREGAIQIQGRVVKLLDRAALQQIMAD